MSSETKFTPGPWQWEINMQSQTLHLVGGRPKHDLTIMDFVRWGMGGAVARLRDTAVDGMNIMHRLPGRNDWIAPFPGREHHADWCANVTHPDMQLIAASPTLYEALSALTDWYEWSLEQSERAADEFKRDTGFLAPYKDVPADMDNFGALSAWREWYATENAKRIAAARTALASARGEG